MTKEYQPHRHWPWPGKDTIWFVQFYQEQDPRYTEGATMSNEGGFAVIPLPEYDRPEIDFSIHFGRSSIERGADAQFEDGSGRIAETLELPVEYYN